jgi:protein involved in polysaccharide export with SLBB domain
MRFTRRQVVRFALALAFAGTLVGTIAAQQPESVYVMGYVKNPGQYALKPEMTVGDALNAAGGFAPGRTVSTLELIRITNGEKQTFEVALTDAVQANDTIFAR